MVQKLKKKPKEPQTINGKTPLQHLYDTIMNDTGNYCRMIVNENLLPIKRDMQDFKVILKLLKNRLIENENRYKALGISIGQLGLAEIHILEKTVQRIMDNISVVDSRGQIMGRINIHRFNLTPVDQFIAVDPQLNQLPKGSVDISE